MIQFCPHCGYNLANDIPVLINDFSMMNSDSPLYWKGSVIYLSGSERIICYSLMRAYPGSVKISTLLGRLDSDAEGNLCEVFISRIRKKLREAGAPNAIAPMHSGHGRGERGYVWIA
jgi:DNA-binding response OmpR family regulator